jgi:riboflavin synthase
MVFTGIVEEIGTVLGVKQDGTHTLRIGARLVLEGTRLGDSLAVDGACLTVSTLGEGWVEVGLAPETLRRTSLGERQAGDSLNLERAVAADGRFGGHYVQGHVDGRGGILDKRSEASSLVLTFSLPEILERYVVEKGFVAVDGISLTVTGTSPGRFSVALVEYTQAAVTLPRKPVGAAVNIEVDILAKYVERLMEARLGTTASR